jgi:putative holliday junction resolvase
MQVTSLLQKNQPLLSGTVLSFDFGKKRIGVAIGEIGIGVAHPLKTVHSEKTAQRFEIIAELIATWQPVALVVGLPTHADGTEHELTRLSKRFARRLEGRFKISITFIDERYTSLVASDMLRELGIKGRKQKSKLDQIAAQQILQSFFDEQQTITTT